MRRAMVASGVAVAALFLLGTSTLAYSAWHGTSDSLPAISAADILTGRATVPPHVAHWVIVESWDLRSPQPVDQFAPWDAVCTGAVALLDVAFVSAVATLVVRRRRRLQVDRSAIGS